MSDNSSTGEYPSHCPGCGREMKSRQQWGLHSDIFPIDTDENGQPLNTEGCRDD